MESKSKFHNFKTLRLLFGNQAVDKFCQKKILLVGVGGIGCQVLKNISKLPISKIVIIDLDIIELSNLNRQFYFRKEHLKQSKAQVAKAQILKLVPELNIQAIQGSIYDKKYDNYHFYSQFDLVISALDNMKARQHLAKNCTRYGKVLIDAGTSGFNGQSYPSIRFLTSCHNCYPSNQEQNFAVCTIRTRPQKSIHCAIYAKNLYEQFFGQQFDDFLHKEILDIKKTLFTRNDTLTHESAQKYGQKLFDYLFNQQFKEKFQSVNTFQWQKTIQLRDKQEVCYKLAFVYEDFMTSSHYAQIFMTSFIKLAQRKLSPENQIKIPEDYDKDDEDCSLFVFSITNLRILNFTNSSQTSSKMKNVTHQQCRKMLGKLIPAIASTNSIAASLQINQMIQFFIRNSISPKYMTISPFNEDKISFSWLSLPNPLCQMCSPKSLYFHIKCSLSERTFEQFQQFALKHCYSYGRDLYCGSLVLIKNINAQKVSANKKKLLNFKFDLLIESTLTVRFLPTSPISDLNIEIILIDDNQGTKSDKKFRILNKDMIQSTIQTLDKQKVKQTKTQYLKRQENISQENESNDWQEIDIE